MSFADFKDNTMRAVVSKTIDGVLKYVNKHDDRTEALLKLTDLSEKLMGDKFEKKVFDGARNLIHNPDAKWIIPKPVNSRRNMDTASRGLF